MAGHSRMHENTLLSQKVKETRYNDKIDMKQKSTIPTWNHLESALYCKSIQNEVMPTEFW